MTDLRAELFAFFTGAFLALAWCFWFTGQVGWGRTTLVAGMIAFALWRARGRGYI